MTRHNTGIQQSNYFGIERGADKGYRAVCNTAGCGWKSEWLTSRSAAESLRQKHNVATILRRSS